VAPQPSSTSPSRLPLFPSDSDVTLTLPAEQFAQLKQALQTTERSN